MAADFGFEVLRLPPYHCIFNPIELIWAWVKTTVAKKNSTFKMADVEKLVNDTLLQVTQKQWEDACKHCHQLVDQFWISDGLQEEEIERVLIQLDGNDSSEESDTGEQ